MKVLNMIFFYVICVLLTGCVAPQFEPKPLSPNSKGIAMVNSTPYSCKVLGEAEGSDETNGRINPAIERLRQGAINDLKNEAVEIVGLHKRVVLYIIKEEALCYWLFEGIKACPAGSSSALGYRVRAQIFDCGDKK